MSAKDSNVSPTLSKRLFLTYLFSLCPLNNPILGSKSRGPSWFPVLHSLSIEPHLVTIGEASLVPFIPLHIAIFVQ